MSDRIVVLDGYALNPGDLSWEPLHALGPGEIFDRSSSGEVVPRARDAAIVISNKTQLPRDVIVELPWLKYIGVTATGYDIVDIEAARQRNVIVTNVPIYGTNSVAQMVFAHLLNLTQHVADHAREVATGHWNSAIDWCFWDYPLCELEGATMGIIGYGRIGQATARLARAFGMRVLAYTPNSAQKTEFASLVDLETVFRESDVVSLHCPLTPDTIQLVNAERLKLMKPTAFLINTSRGGLVDEVALAEALNSNQLAGAGLDVLPIEPPTSESPLFTAKNCYITPHIAWATHASRQRLLDTAVENVAAFLRGQPQNVVN